MSNYYVISEGRFAVSSDCPVRTKALLTGLQAQGHRDFVILDGWGGQFDTEMDRVFKTPKLGVLLLLPERDVEENDTTAVCAFMLGHGQLARLRSVAQSLQVAKVKYGIVDTTAVMRLDDDSELNEPEIIVTQEGLRWRGKSQLDGEVMVSQLVTYEALEAFLNGGDIALVKPGMKSEKDFMSYVLSQMQEEIGDDEHWKEGFSEQLDIFIQEDKLPLAVMISTLILM